MEDRTVSYDIFNETLDKIIGSFMMIDYVLGGVIEDEDCQLDELPEVFGLIHVVSRKSQEDLFAIQNRVKADCRIKKASKPKAATGKPRGQIT